MNREVRNHESKFNKIREAARKKNAEFTPGARVDTAQILRDPDNTGPVRTWSFSTLKDFETCKYRVYLSKVEKVPLPKGSAAATRGTRIHDLAERFVKGEFDELPKELQKFQTQFLRLRARYGGGVIEAEENWGFTRDWEPVGWDHPDLWCRMKVDALERSGDDSVYVIDYKTGKKFGNEIKHTDQGICYAIGTIMRMPEIKSLQIEFWYLDKGEMLQKLFTRAQLLLLVPNLERRAYLLTTCKEFDPSPSANNCRWCPHKETDTCAYAE